MAVTYEIYPLPVGELRQFPMTNLTYAHRQGEMGSVPLLAFLLRGSNGKNILVDTGSFDGAWSQEHLGFPIAVTEEDRVDRVLRRRFGLEPGDVDYLINTHLHFDHCFNNHLFPGKKIYVQKAELLFAMAPYEMFRWTYLSPQTGILANWLTTADQFALAEGDTDLDDGLSLLLLPGHSPGLQGVLVDTREGKYLLAGDLVNLQEQLEGDGVVSYIIPGLHTSVTDCMASMERVKGLARDGVRVLASHDYKTLESPVYPPREGERAEG